MRFHIGNVGKKRIGWLLICAVCTGFAVLLESAPVLSDLTTELEARAWDWRVKLASRRAVADRNIRLIVIDQNSLDVRERDGMTWPWPRSIYVPVIKYLEQAGAKGVAFDMLFTEASFVGPNEDMELAEATAGELPVAVAMGFTGGGKGPGSEKFRIFRERQLARNAESSFEEKFLAKQRAPTHPSALLPTVELLENCRGFGNVVTEPDSDGIFRHYLPGGYVGDTPVLGLPFAFYDIVEGKEARPLDVERFLDRENRLTVRFNGGEDIYPTYSIDSVINSYVDQMEGNKPRIDPSSFRDAWVFVGPSAPGLMDLRPNPLCDRCMGVFLNATVLDNILHRNFIVRLPTAAVLAFTAILVGLSSGALFALPRLRYQLMAAAIILIGSLYFSAYLAHVGYWLNLVAPFAAAMLGIILTFGLQYQLEGRQHRFIKNAFQYYVSSGVIDKIVEDPSQLSLGGEKKELSTFFSDIAGFTSISESLEASKLVALLNGYLSLMTDTILEYNGTVDKYVGDAVIAFWNAPVTIEDHALRSVRAALRCQAELAKMRPIFRKEFGVDVHTRIGINTDPVSVGNFGSRSRFNYTVIGDGANLASRLEGANKAFGTPILVSHSTYSQLRGLIYCRKVADIRVLGKVEIVGVYEPLELDRATFTDLKIFDESREAYEAGDLEAAKLGFQRLESDYLARSYLKKIEREMPSWSADRAAWSPIWNMTEK